MELHESGKRLNLLYAMAELTNDRTELRNESLQALMAAGETTAVLISNVFFALSRHPEALRRLREEISSIENKELDFDLLHNMDYLRKIFNESMARAAKERGCKPPPSLPQKDPFFGLDIVYSQLYGIYKPGHRNATFQKRFDKYGNTF